MRTRSTAVLLALTAGAMVVPAVSASARQDGPTGLGIRLLEAPESGRGNPRASAYIVDHVAAGTAFSRAIEVVNDTDERRSIQLYDAAAEIRDGSFTVLEGRAQNRLTDWVSVEPPAVDLGPGRSARAVVSVNVDQSAPDGEYYGAALAERPPPPDSTGVGVATRVGIRIYLSVGSGAEPASDFRVDSLTAERMADGRPVVRASVLNTGGRALDLAGDLGLSEGPGGISAGPFAAELGTTLGLNQRSPVTVLLDPALPAGPWLATVTARSGSLARTAQAMVTFPAPGSVAAPVAAEPVLVPADNSGLPWWAFAVGGFLLLLVVIFLLLILWRRRKDDDDPPDLQPPGAPASRGRPRRAPRQR